MTPIQTSAVYINL